MFDVGIIGAGPAGYIAAIKAAQKGLNVVLFEKQHIVIASFSYKLANYAIFFSPRPALIHS